VCTKTGKGICFKEDGSLLWTPSGHLLLTAIFTFCSLTHFFNSFYNNTQGKLSNPTLLRFTTSIEPAKNVYVRDLVIDIFRSSPELIRQYFCSWYPCQRKLEINIETLFDSLGTGHHVTFFLSQGWLYPGWQWWISLPKSSPCLFPPSNPSIPLLLMR